MICKLEAAAVLTAVLLVSGCATSRSEIKLKSPTIAAPAVSVTSVQHVVVIGKITDERVFAQAPDDPSVPSLGFGGADKAADDVKARAVGRKRNGYGKALGDVLLQSGQTVESVVRENLVAALQQAGYQVKGEGDAGPSPPVVDVHIKQFWSWFTPGFFAVTLSNNIATDLVFNGTGAPVVVSTHVEDEHAVATDGDWMQIVDKGLDAYRAEVSRRMRSSEMMATAVPASVKSAAVATEVATAAVASEPTTHRVTAKAAPKPTTVAEPESRATMPSPTSSPSPRAVVAVKAPSPAAMPQDSTANAAIAPLAQSVAIQLGCGAVQANGARTFIAPCGDYSVLIDCDSGQCRPMHTVKVKHDE